MITEIPLLPINAVLFPGGTLQMRITEERHLRLVTQVIASRKPLGVVLAALDGQKGREAVSVGCMGKITYWATEKPRVMEITLLGLQRFRTITGWRHANGLPMAWVLPVNKTHHAVDHGFLFYASEPYKVFLIKQTILQRGTWAASMTLNGSVSVWQKSCLWRLARNNTSCKLKIQDDVSKR